MFYIYILFFLEEGTSIYALSTLFITFLNHKPTFNENKFILVLDNVCQLNEIHFSFYKFLLMNSKVDCFMIIMNRFTVCHNYYIYLLPVKYICIYRYILILCLLKCNIITSTKIQTANINLPENIKFIIFFKVLSLLSDVYLFFLIEI